MSLECIGYSCSVIGGREMNQDSFLVKNDRGLFAVADGVGGGMDGDVASAMAMDAVDRVTTSPELLKEAIKEAQEKILAEAMQKHGAPVMGTTVTAIAIDDGQVTMCHVGDSRCYLFREGNLFLKTEDQEFYDESMGATVLGSYLGIPTDEHALELLEDVFTVVPGDRLLLCSDGLSRQMEEPQIAEHLRNREQDPNGVVERLCEEASLKPYSDNVTIVLVDVLEKNEEEPLS